MLSLQSQILLEDLHHPYQIFVGQATVSDQVMAATEDYKAPSSHSLSCDIQLIDASPLPSYEDELDDHSYYANPSAGLLIRRVGYDGQFLGSRPLPECATEGRTLGRVSIPFTLKRCVVMNILFWRDF